MTCSIRSPRREVEEVRELETAADGVLTAKQAPRRPGTAPSFSLGQTIWLDANAAGWGWFVDQAA